MSEEADETDTLEVPASPGLWLGAIISFVLFATPNLMTAVAMGKTGEDLIGYVAGIAIWPFLIAYGYTRQKGKRNQRALVKAFMITCLVLFGMALILIMGGGRRH
jgi:hypothetical protein